MPRWRHQDDQPDDGTAGHDAGGMPDGDDVLWVPDPSRDSFVTFQDGRLTAVFLRDPLACASVEEYANKTGLDAEQVLSELSPYLQQGALDIEPVGDQLFVHTAPHGRPVPHHLPDVAPNLWELLRAKVDPQQAHALWQVVRDFERSGWQVELRDSRIQAGLGQMFNPPALGVVLRNGLTVPVETFPPPGRVAAPDGVLSRYEHAGARAVAVTCADGALDATVTAVRQWVIDRLERGWTPMLHVVVLEAPRFNPTFLAPSDSSVTPVAVSNQLPTSLTWED